MGPSSTKGVFSAGKLYGLGTNSLDFSFRKMIIATSGPVRMVLVAIARAIRPGFVRISLPILKKDIVGLSVFKQKA